MIEEQKIPKTSALLDEKIKAGLKEVLRRMEQPVVLKAVVDLDEGKSRELAGFLSVLTGLEEKLSVEFYEPEDAPEGLDTVHLPVTGLYEEGQYSGVSFHGVPGGQEINSFVIGIYNLAGPGQTIDEKTRQKIAGIQAPVQMKIFVSLACHHCPKVVAVCQKMAVLNPQITGEMYDAVLYKDLIEQYQIERVPMVVINDSKVVLGEKSIEQMADIVKEMTEMDK